MNALSNTSRILAADLRRAERSIHAATRDTAQFLLTTLDATEAHQLSPAMTQRTVKATLDALTALVDSQRHVAMRAHPAIEKVGHHLGLSAVDWGTGDPKPPIGLAVSEVELG